MEVSAVDAQAYAYEDEARQAGFSAVCGIDEAGRGPLAGPVFAAAVILPAGLVIDGLDDSKRLSPQKREALFDVIRREAVAWGVGQADEREIDEINILQATFIAMRRAVAAMRVSPDCALVDGNRDPQLGIPTTLIVKGDSKSASVAAASILAKVSRDRLMLAYDKIYPEYAFAQHKGYPTRMHYERLENYGPCVIHRKSFLKKTHLLEKPAGIQ